MIKKLTAAVAIGIFAIAGAAQATVTIEVDAGILRNMTGTATVPVGGLLQLIASRDGTANFALPTTTSFTGGSANNLVVATFAMNNNFGIGETDNTVVLTLENTSATASATQFDIGDPLLLRWYPTLTTASTAPGLGTSYGQYRSTTGVTTGATTSLPWTTPSDGGSFFYPGGLELNTIAAGGTTVETAGFASRTVVPEPSALIFLGLTGLGLGGMYFRRRLSA